MGPARQSPSRRGRSTLGPDDSVRGFLRETKCENDPLSILRHGAQICLLPLVGGTRSQSRRGCAAHQTATRQSNSQPASQPASEPVKAVYQIMADVREEENKRLPRSDLSWQGASADLVCAQWPCARAFSSARVREHDFAPVPGRNLDDLGPREFGQAGTLANSGDQSHQAKEAGQESADRRQQTASRGKACRNAGNESTRRRC